MFHLVINLKDRDEILFLVPHNFFLSMPITFYKLSELLSVLSRTLANTYLREFIPYGLFTVVQVAPSGTRLIWEK